MPDLIAHDGTRLAYRVAGQGRPVVCLQGGPMMDATYLGDLGGLSEHVQLILPDYRGTGASQTPADITSCRCDRLVDDVEALRAHLGLDQLDLLAHCAGANVAVQYAARHPERVHKLAMITPSTMAIGVTATGEDRREIVRRREGEPWFEHASNAFEKIQAGEAADWEAIAPFTYGRWDAAAQAHYADMETHRNWEAAAAFVAEGAFTPEATRPALAEFDAPVLLLAGELDTGAPPPVVAGYTALFPNHTYVTQEGGGHFPWVDNPTWFAQTVATFLA
ncbi:alpha/beta hydrolase [Lentzea tibetensis]|uniref:Alpha/beta hydrolase n=1 Tax=Lentzea tibetensis TaxID=2591470 RepID=A0A563ELE0_9PSEU|nr:alpha/beta hydrolase [Lentzea tibetensis]TWP47919.1 alpha/beta hydrolase [Lentzea tibetensis]